MFTCAPRGSAATGSKRGKVVKRGKRPWRSTCIATSQRPRPTRSRSRPPCRRTADRQREQDWSSTPSSRPSSGGSPTWTGWASTCRRSRRRRVQDLLPRSSPSSGGRPRASSTSAWRRSSRRTRTASSRSARCRCRSRELAVAELEYCMKKLGFRGIELGTNVRRAELSDERFEPVFAKAEELGAVVFLHPAGFTDTSRLESTS